MHLISRKRLLEAANRHLELAAPLETWYRIAKAAEWTSLVDVRRQLPTADAVNEYTVFNIKGNAYRLITQVFYDSAVILVREVLTHAQYDKEGWKR